MVQKNLTVSATALPPARCCIENSWLLRRRSRGHLYDFESPTKGQKVLPFLGFLKMTAMKSEKTVLHLDDRWWCPCFRCAGRNQQER
jgi:hypothetical protein